MNKLSFIIQSIITRLPQVQTIEDLEIVFMYDSFYVYFSYEGKCYRVDENLSVSNVFGSILSSDSNSYLLQEKLRGR